MYDAIIVGARCGGAPTAMQLARKGYDVLVVDRAHFPSDTLSTHCLTGDAVPRLAQWGVLERLLAAGCRPVPGTVMTAGEAQSKTLMPPGAFGLNPRRTVLDAVLVGAAREAGAELHEGVSVSRVVVSADGRVTGIEGTAADGSPVAAEGRVVIGADGRNSTVAKAVAAEAYNVLPGLTCAYYSYFEGFAAEMTEVWFAPGHAVFAFPTDGGRTCLAAEFPRGQFERVRADIEAAVEAAFASYPELRERYQQATRVEQWMGMLSAEWYYRKPYGPGWALVGDAGYLKDPVLGMGINDAFRDADLLAAALDEAFSGRQPYEAALASYQQQRDAATAMLYAVNYEVSTLQVGPEMLRMLAAGREQAMAGQA